MKFTKENIIKTEYVYKVRCDRCLVEYTDHDCFEVQEMHFIDFVGGYGSVFGDGCQVKCDLCQACLLDLIGDFCKEVECA